MWLLRSSCLMKNSSITKLAGLTVLIAILSLGTSNTFALSAFSTDFNAGSPPEFSGITTNAAVQGYSGLGTGTNTFAGSFLHNESIPPQVTKLTLTGLSSHSSIDIKFLLAIIDSWDGIGCITLGGDTFNVKVDGNLIFSKVFENSGPGCPGGTSGIQSYVPPPGVQLAHKQNLGFHVSPIPPYGDSAYNMGLDPTFQNIPHTANTLTIEWFASGDNWQGGTDESWAIENVEIDLSGVGPVVGGELLPIDNTALLVAGIQSSTIWMLPALAGIAGASAYFVRTRMNKDN